MRLVSVSVINNDDSVYAVFTVNRELIEATQYPDPFNILKICIFFFLSKNAIDC